MTPQQFWARKAGGEELTTFAEFTAKVTLLDEAKWAREFADLLQRGYLPDAVHLLNGGSGSSPHHETNLRDAPTRLYELCGGGRCAGVWSEWFRVPIKRMVFNDFSSQVIGQAERLWPHQERPGGLVCGA